MTTKNRNESGPPTGGNGGPEEMRGRDHGLRGHGTPVPTAESIPTKLRELRSFVCEKGGWRERAGGPERSAALPRAVAPSSAQKGPWSWRS